jgi:uncharacterized protein (DUF433 family)
MAGIVAGSMGAGALIGAVVFTPGVGIAATGSASDGVTWLCEGVLENGPIEAAAEAIGVEPSELLSELRDGATIAEVAQEHGVESSAVVDAIVAEHRERLDQAVEDGVLTQEEADERAAELEERVAGFVNGDVDLPFLDGPRPDGPPLLGRPGRWGFADGPLAAAADAIGIRPVALLEELADGSTIADVARDHDVATSDVVDAIVASLRERLDAAVANGWITQEEADERAAALDEQATSIVNGDLAPFPFPGPFGPHHGWLDGRDGANADATEVSLA